MASTDLETASDKTPDQKLPALGILRESKGSVARDALKKTLKSEDDRMRVEAAAALLPTGDLEALEIAEERLMRGAPGDAELVTLCAGLSQVDKPAAIASLLRLLQADASETRQAAVTALRRVKSQAAAPALVRMLRDTNREVRLAAVRALAAIAEEPHWHPSDRAFQENEAEFVAHWEYWAKQRGIK